jgi:hypothetical protein
MRRKLYGIVFCTPAFLLFALAVWNLGHNSRPSLW